MNAEQIISTELDLADFDPVAFEEGQEAFDNGEPEITNPYVRGSAQNRAWKAGWGVALSASTQRAKRLAVGEGQKESDLEEYHRRIGEIFLAGGQTPYRICKQIWALHAEFERRLAKRGENGF